MNVAYISVLSALGGSVVGGLVSGVANMAEPTRAGNGREARPRSGAAGGSLQGFSFSRLRKRAAKLSQANDPKIEDIVAPYASISRMRVRSSPQIVACADNVLRVTPGTYFAPNKTISELHDMIEKRDQGLDVLREFSEFEREELRTF